MKVYIQSICGVPWNDECRIALEEFSAQGAECVLFSNTEELENIKAGDIVVAGTMVTHHVFNMLGYNVKNYSYPNELHDYYGRVLHRIRASDLLDISLPVFIKPVEDKLAKGIVAHSIKDLDEYLILPINTELVCSEVVKFVSEWRCYVANRTILGVKHYAGDPQVVCDETVICDALNTYKSSPAGFAIDFGVTEDGRTLIVEVNDGFALGCYGLDSKLYCELLAARWHELAYNEDVRLCPIINREISEMECYEFRMGCADSAPYKYYSKYNFDEMHSICSQCKFNVL